MQLCVTLLLLMGLSGCTVTDDKERAHSAEAGSWVTMTLEVTLGSSREWSMGEGAEDSLCGGFKAMAPGLTELQLDTCTWE